MNSSAIAQRHRIVEALLLRGSRGLTTIEAREELDCMYVSARILELRQMGWHIPTVWTTSENAQGNKLRNARYVLITRARESE